jgi:hypothetical protein
MTINTRAADGGASALSASPPHRAAGNRAIRARRARMAGPARRTIAAAAFLVRYLAATSTPARLQMYLDPDGDVTRSELHHPRAH